MYDLTCPICKYEWEEGELLGADVKCPNCQILLETVHDCIELDDGDYWCIEYIDKVK